MPIKTLNVQEFNPASNPSENIFATGWDYEVSVNPVYYIKNYLGYVQLSNEVKHFSGGGALIATLPAGYRPSTLKRFLVYARDSLNNFIPNAQVAVTQYGEITVADFSAGMVVRLDQVSFYTNT